MSTSMPTPTIVAAIHTSTATAMIEAPTPTLVLPIATPVGQPTPTTVVITEQVEFVKVFLIALEDNGRSGPLVGCGDSLVPITLAVPRAPGVLAAGLEKLLEKRQFYADGLYNALYQSDLRLAGVTFESGTIMVHLTGTIMLGGACDAPRLEAQLEQTASQFSTDNVAVFINDVPLEEVLSQK